MGRAVGGSTGTNVWAALGLIADMTRSRQSGSVVTLLCDSGDRYLSTYYDDAWLADNGIDIDPYAVTLTEYDRTGEFRPPGPTL
jgi:cysteine synthase